MLDYGCGVGDSTRRLMAIFNEAGKRCEMHGVDINEHCVAEARRNIPDANLRKIDSGRLPDEFKDFDLIFASYVLCEIRSDEVAKVLQCFYDALADKGIVVLINVTSKGMNSAYDWYGVKSQAVATVIRSNGHRTLMEDQDVQWGFLNPANNAPLITFNDIFHSETAFKRMYAESSFDLIEKVKVTVKPPNVTTSKFWAPDKLHVLMRMRRQLC